MINRRSFFARTAAAVAVGAPHIAKSADALIAAPGQKPKRIIPIVSDGMSMGTLTCADIFSQLTRKRPLTWTQLWKNPAARTAMMNTRSLNSLVTDSSAASSAWGSGTRAALARLERADNFILQVEGSRIDHSAHNSDAPAALHDQIALDEAIDVCLKSSCRLIPTASSPRYRWRARPGIGAGISANGTSAR